MKTKKTPWINILAAPIIVAGFGLAGSTTVADHCDSTDVNQSGAVDIDDLLLVIEDWGEECDWSDEDDQIPNWARGDFPLQGDGSSTQSSDGRTINVYDHNGGGMEHYKVNNYTLMQGPSEDNHKLRVTIELDLDDYVRTEDSGAHASPVFFLTGYKVQGQTTPINYNSTYGKFYYGDRNHPYGPGTTCVTGTPGDPSGIITLAELDLFEIGSGSICPHDPTDCPADDGSMNLMQVTGHPRNVPGGPGCGSGGTYIGLQDHDPAAYSQYGVCAEYQSLQTNDGSKHLGLDITKPFKIVYVIEKTQMTMTVSQDGLSDQNVVWGGGGQGCTPPMGVGVPDWDMYEYFAATIGVNNGYGPADPNTCAFYNQHGDKTIPGLQISAAQPGDFKSWTASELEFELDKADGSGFQPCQPVDLVPGNLYGYGNSAESDCSETAKRVKVQ